jgi:type II secretory pathway predicted ATPase ExeA
MNKKLLALYSLKYNPFSPDVPAAALFVPPALESFCWRIEQQAREGGFALVSGEPGTGKSVSLRVLSERLGAVRDLSVGVLSRPQASMADFYRELGHLFGVALRPHNRWNGAQALREKWQAHIETTLSRPVLLVDEAQEMKTAVLCELRLLASAELDARCILTIVLAGDSRLAERFASPELLPLASRIRTRLRTEAASPQALRQALAHRLQQAGNARLLSAAVQDALAEHACGNFRALLTMANDLLALAAQREAEQIDEKLFFEAFDPQAAATAAKRRKP